jgi:DNA replication protein DnaC
MENYEWEGVHPPSLKGRLATFLAEVETVGGAPHILLTGLPGIGKTHLGVAIYRYLAARLGTGWVTWLNVPEFCEQVKRAYSDGSDPWEDIECAHRLVVLDDLFGRELTAHEKDQIITRLLDTAYQNNAAVLATMNQDVGELAARLPAHEISRLLASATIIPMRANTDRRRG